MACAQHAKLSCWFVSILLVIYALSILALFSLVEDAAYHKVSSYVITNEKLKKAYSCLQRCVVANTSTKSSVAYNGLSGGSALLE